VSRRWEDNSEHNHEMMIDSIRCRRDEPTEYEAPETDQKWRARNVISFHFRHLNHQPPPAYRDVMLCAIDHANPTTGRSDARQRMMAVECNLSRETVNRALRWWEVNTAYLEIENRGAGRSNAYHIQWASLEADWHGIQERILDATPTSFRRHADRGVTTHITGGVITDVTPGVITDVTPRTLKGNLKEEPHPEWAHTPSARDALHLESDFLDRGTQPTSERVESQKATKEELERLSSLRGGVEFWRKKVIDLVATLKTTVDRFARNDLEAKILEYRNRMRSCWMSYALRVFSNDGETDSYQLTMRRAYRFFKDLTMIYGYDRAIIAEILHELLDKVESKHLTKARAAVRSEAFEQGFRY
jgi:hypothetical protein